MFKNKTVIIVVVVLALAAIAYGVSGMGSSNSNTTGVSKQAVGTSANTNTTTNPATALDGPGKEFVAQLLAIQNIAFNLDLFRDPVFQGMQDFSREIQPQEAGRPNPFAPLGDDTRVDSPATPEQAISNVNTPPAKGTPPTKTPVKKTLKK
jgi:hypothetical protein